MCQSKAEGGIRCSSHAVLALQRHADKQVEMVKEYAAAKGITLQDESTMYNSFEHSTGIFLKVQEKSAYKKTENAFYNAKKDASELEHQLVSVASFRNPSSVADHLWQRSRVVKETTALRDKAWQEGREAEADASIAKLQALRVKTAAEAQHIVDIVTRNGKHNLIDTLKSENSTPGYLSDAQAKAEYEKNVYLDVRKKLTAEEKHRFISKKFRETPEYKDVTRSVAFRVQPAVREWEGKQKELQQDYSMTGEFKQKMEDMASFHEAGSPEHEKIQAHLRKIEILKKLTIARNQREAGVVKEPATV